MKTSLALALFFSLAFGTSYATEDSARVTVFTIEESIVIDGHLDDAAWAKATAASPFWQWFPTDSGRSQAKTEIYMLRDDEYLYVAAKCYSKGDDYIIPSLRRDFQAGGNDNVTLMFDPFNDRRNAFLFGLNPYGVKREAIVSGGGTGSNSFNTAWDNKWEGAAKIHDGYYICEFAIPFKTLRFLAGGQKWGFNCYRFDTQYNEWSVWTHVPRNQFFFRLGFMGDMLWQEPLEKAGSNFALIPYATAGTSRDYEEGQGGSTFFDIGGDAKVAITSGINLDLTVNPDFSQVEVDEQVTNLTRFEVFFPERRQFFLENADLFGSFGDRDINPFFSRRIGITRDTTTDLNIQNPIYAGARLSGKLTDKVRVGLLNMQAARSLENGLPSYNYSVAAVQRQIKSKSNIGAIFVNKQHFSSTHSEDHGRFNRVVGMDYNLLSEDNAWDGKVFYHRSFSEVQQDEAFAHGASLGYNHRNIEINWEHSLVGEGYDAEVGFVPRTNYFRTQPEIQILLYPKRSSKIINHGPGVEVNTLWTRGFGRSDEELQFYWNFSFSGNQRMRVWISKMYTYLFDPFDPTRTDSAKLPADTEYHDVTVGFFHSTDQRKKLSLRSIGQFGEFFDGRLYQLRGTATYRYQPYGSIALNFNFSRVELAAPYASTNLVLLGPRIDFTFSKKLFLTTFLQFNNQVENLNINARLQWRYKPVSDLYIVYTDNYDTHNFAIRNRALVAKVTYWLNT